MSKQLNEIVGDNERQLPENLQRLVDQNQISLQQARLIMAEDANTKRILLEG